MGVMWAFASQSDKDLGRASEDSRIYAAIADLSDPIGLLNMLV